MPLPPLFTFYYCRKVFVINLCIFFFFIDVVSKDSYGLKPSFSIDCSYIENAVVLKTLIQE